MAEFDPNAYLQGQSQPTSEGFDPDAYLGSSAPTPQIPSQQEIVANEVKQAVPGEPLEVPKGLSNPSTSASKAFLQGATTSLRALDQVRKRAAVSSLPSSVQPIAQQVEKSYEVPYVTAEGNLPEGDITSQVAGLAGQAVDPLVLLSGGVGGRVAARGAEKLGLVAADAELAAYYAAMEAGKRNLQKQLFQNGANAVVRDTLKRGIVQGTAEGVTGGAAAGLVEAAEKGQEGIEALSTIGKYAGLGGPLVAATHGLGGALLQKSAFKKALKDVPEGFLVTNSPAKQALADQLTNLHAEKASILANDAEFFAKNAERKLTLQNKFDRLEKIKERLGLRQQAAEESVLQQPTEILPASERTQVGLPQQNLDKQLEDLRQGFNRRSDALEKRYQTLIQEQQALPSDIERTVKSRDRLRDIYDELAKIEAGQRELDYLGVAANVKLGEKNAALSKASQIAVENAHRQVQKVKELGSLGLFSAEDAEKLAKLEFDNAFAVQGLTSKPYNPGWLDSITNQVERWSGVQAATGVNTGKTALDAQWALNQVGNRVNEQRDLWEQSVKALMDRGYSKEQIAQTLQYFEGQGFNPNPVTSKSLTRPAWPLPTPPSPEEQQLFMGMRGQLNSLRDYGVEKGVFKPGQYAEGFVPIRELPQDVAMPGSAQRFTNPAVARQRVEGALIPGMHDLDINRLFNRYATQLFTATEVSPVVKEGVLHLAELKAMKQDKTAQLFEKYLKDTFHIDNSIPLEQLFGEQVLRDNEQSMAQAFMEQGLSESALEELHKALSRTFYKNVVSRNPKQLLLQFVQTDFLLPAEVGLQNHAWARAKAYTKEGQQQVKHLLSQTVREDLPGLEELRFQAPKSAIAKAFHGLEEGTKRLDILSKGFNAQEKVNRTTALLAASHKFDQVVGSKGLVGVDELTQNLLPSEKQYVMNAFEKKGADAAKAAYALMIDRRVNFSYSLADRPELLRKVGAYVPFTTFARNIIQRYASDLAQGNVGKVAGRLANVYLAKAFYEGLTNRSFSSQDPYEQTKNLAENIPIIPAEKQLVKGVYKTLTAKNSKEALKQAQGLADFFPIPGVSTAVRVKRNLEKKGNPLGLDKASPNAFVKYLFK